MIRVIQLLAVGLLAAAYAMPAAAQGQFSPRVYVNDRVVTQYEVDQRYAFLQLLRAPGDVEDLAIRGLIDDRLRVQAAEEMGLKVSEEQIAAGMAEFAGRANLETEQLIELIGQAGIAPETLRDFVASGMIWRDVARGRFGPRAIVSDAEVDRALSLTSEKGGMRVLLSEIILPDTLDSIRLATELAGSITSQAAFAAAAKEYSKSDSAAEGGRLNWIPLSNLPPQIVPQLLSSRPGGVTQPVRLGGTIALFQLVSLDQTEGLAGLPVAVDYAQFLIPGGRGPAALAEAARIRGEVDACNDLYAVADGLPESQLQRVTQSPSEIPQDIALELAKLDENESSTALTRGDALVFLMLCSRRLDDGGFDVRAAVRERLVNQKIAGMAEIYLEELRSEATIRYP